MNKQPSLRFPEGHGSGSASLPAGLLHHRELEASKLPITRSLFRLKDILRYSEMRHYQGFREMHVFSRHEAQTPGSEFLSS